jgi:hypothetical protein
VVGYDGLRSSGANRFLLASLALSLSSESILGHMGQEMGCDWVCLRDGRADKSMVVSDVSQRG